MSGAGPPFMFTNSPGDVVKKERSMSSGTIKWQRRRPLFVSLSLYLSPPPTPPPGEIGAAYLITAMSRSFLHAAFY